MRVLTLAFVGVMAVSAPRTVCAQGSGDAAAWPDELQAGDQVTLALDDTVVRGTLLTIDTRKLVVRTDSGPIDVPVEAVHEARRRRIGFLLGTIIGAAAAVAPAWALSSWLTNEGHDATGPTLLVIGSGAAIGAGIDALLNRNRVVYRRKATGPPISLAPAIGTKQAGIQLSVSW